MKENSTDKLDITDKGILYSIGKVDMLKISFFTLCLLRKHDCGAERIRVYYRRVKPVAPQRDTSFAEWFAEDNM